MDTITERKVTYQAKIVKKAKGVYLLSSANKSYLKSLSFEKGSELFVSILGALKKAGYTPSPDDPGIIVPDPFGILTGKKRIPWQLLNPAADNGCIKCETVCHKDPIAGYNCVEACQCYPCG